MDPSSTAIQFVGATNAAVVQVQALLGQQSAAPHDQIISCQYTNAGSSISAEFRITVQEPSPILAVYNGGKTTISAGLIHRKVVYQVIDQFGGNITDVVSYQNEHGQTVSVTVIKLLALEVLNSISGPVGTPAYDIPVTDTGRFSDTIQFNEAVTTEYKQDLYVYVDKVGESIATGNKVRSNRITVNVVGGSIVVELWPDGPVIPESP